MSHSFLAARQRNVVRQKRVHGRIRRPQNRRVRARHAPIRSAHFPGRLGRQRLGQAYATGLTPHGFAAIHREAQGVVKLTFTGGVSQRFQPFFDHYPLGTNREAARTINAYARSFFKKWLKGQDDRLHEGPSPDFPRVINFRKK